MIFHLPTMDLMMTSACNMRCTYCFEDKKTSNNLKFEDVREYLENGGTMSYFILGGEPFMNVQFLKDFFDWLFTKKDIPDFVGKASKWTSRKIITNGTLVPKHIDFIKKYKLILQISIDGPKHVHDMHRVGVDGKGTYDKAMAGVEAAASNEIDFTLHGVITKDRLPFLAEISQWFFEKNWKYFGKEKAIDALQRNEAMVIFEEEYTDEDIGIIIKQIGEFIGWIWKHEKLSIEEKGNATRNYLSKQGGRCGVGTGLMAVDTDLEIFPCHRQADSGEREKERSRLGNIYDNKGLENFKLFNRYFKGSKLYPMQYSYKTLNKGFIADQPWLMWCPSTNEWTSGADNPFYISSKYAVMNLEIQRFIDQLLAYYKIPRGGPKRGNVRHRNR